MNSIRFALAASAIVLGSAASAMAGDFDGAWAGQGVVQGATSRKGVCATPPMMQMTVKNNVAQGKAAIASGNKPFRWPIKADGSIDTDDMKGKFEGAEFNGSWAMPTQTGSCAFGIHMKKEG